MIRRALWGRPEKKKSHHHSCTPGAMGAKIDKRFDKGMFPSVSL